MGSLLATEVKQKVFLQEASLQKVFLRKVFLQELLLQEVQQQEVFLQDPSLHRVGILQTVKINCGHTIMPLPQAPP
jgi:hypothetical protein